MSDFGEMHHPVARKDHRCEWCYTVIPKSEEHKQYRSIWEGNWQNWRMHDECYKVAAQDARGMAQKSGRGRGQRWEAACHCSARNAQ